MEMKVNVEIIENNKYYSTVDAKGNTTMVFVWDGQMYVQTNNSPARCVEDVKRLSKTAKALIEYVSAIKEEAEEEVIENPRYAAFKKAHGKQPNYVYMAFINEMKILYCGDLYGSISDHDEFTKFIEFNAHKFEPLGNAELLGYGHPSSGL
ncbi:hypothetical protein [Vibrio phage vB_VaM_H2]|nr:hypothetical protein [Vibrio phage vB_VaM_H2]